MKKKLLTLAFLLILLCVFQSCTNDNTFSGEVVTNGSMPEMFVLKTSGEKIGFIIDENTEFVFSKEMLEEINYFEGEKLSDYFGCSMEADVIAGGITSPAENYIPSDVENWYFAKTVTVTDIYDEYFFAES